MKERSGEQPDQSKTLMLFFAKIVFTYLAFTNSWGRILLKYCIISKTMEHIFQLSFKSLKVYLIVHYSIISLACFAFSSTLPYSSNSNIFSCCFCLMTFLTVQRVTQTFLDIFFCVSVARSYDVIIFLRFLGIISIKALLSTQPWSNKNLFKYSDNNDSWV